jgi:hypothetical protein
MTKIVIVQDGVAPHFKRQNERQKENYFRDLFVELFFSYGKHDEGLYAELKQIPLACKNKLVLFVFDGVPDDEIVQHMFCLKKKFPGFNFLFYKVNNGQEKDPVLGITVIDSIQEIIKHFKLLFTKAPEILAVTG